MSERGLGRQEELLAEALERAPEDRDKYLTEACGKDPYLRREVEELLSLHDHAAAYFEDLQNDIVTAAPLELESAARPRLAIGPYRALEAIGRGGMGAVYHAERVDGAFDQTVALKLLHRDMETPQLKTRFLAERQLLAQLSHPHIARLLDGGVTDEGRPYFVMEYVDGVPITDYCQSNSLPMESVLGLFLDVIDAVSYLHRNLVVHRDLKPSNIFVGRNGQVKLLDFGIAKLLADDLDESGRTRTGELLMTPEYAAPEQLMGAPVTTATDVYALGVVLFELLTGRRPHPRESARDSHQLPPTPSSLLRSRSGRAAARSPGQTDSEPSSEIRTAWSRIAGDLDNICLMALRPEPDARYPTADQLGQDIGRYLAGHPVAARKSTLAYRVTRFVRRQRRAVVAAIMLLALAAFGFYRERTLRGVAEEARSEAQVQAAKAVAVSDFLGDLLSSADPRNAQGKEVTVAEVLDQAAERIAVSKELADQPSVEAAVRSTIGNTYVSLGKHNEAKEHLERAVELLGGLESHDPEALSAAVDVGLLYIRLGLYDEAENLLQRALELHMEILGEDHPNTLTAMGRLADLYFYANRLDEVEQLDRKTLEIRRRVLGENHPDTLRSLNGLATTLFSRGRYAEAAKLFEQALVLKRQELGESHPDTLMLANNLSATYVELSRYPEAEMLLRQLVSTRTKVLGDHHEDTLMTIHNLGVLLIQQGRYGEAEEQLRQAVAAREHMPGQERSYLFSSSYLADVYRNQGRHEEAEALYLKTLEQQRELLGSKSGETLRTISALADLRVQQGNLKAAEALLVGILDAQVEARGEEHPDTLDSLTTMARIRNKEGRFEDAMVFCDTAIEAGSRGLGPEHLVVLAAVLEQARALAGMGELQAALKLATRVHEVRARVLGEEHPATVGSRDLLESLQTPAGGHAKKTSPGSKWTASPALA